MRVRVSPGASIKGEAIVPGDKSISHRWLVLAASARGKSHLVGLPRSLDTMSTASCLAGLSPAGGPALEAWASRPSVAAESHGSTWNRRVRTLDVDTVDLQGEGRGGLTAPTRSLDCGNSGTTMRLLAGLVAASPFTTVLTGDESLVTRPMDRVAAPLREMGATVTTAKGRPPVTVRGGRLRGIRYEPRVPSAQVKGAVLLAAAAAQGVTSIAEPVATRDHTERALRALGAAIRVGVSEVNLEGPFQHGGLDGTVPGDPSAAAFLLGAVALSGSELTLGGVGLNPSRLRFLQVMRAMGIEVDTEVEAEVLEEPVGTMHLRPAGGVRPVRVEPEDLPLVLDEVPVLAAIAAHAAGESRFEGAGELRVKESDRLTAMVEGIRGLGGEASIDGEDLVVAGGGLRGGSARAAGDHRIAMALTVSALAAETVSEIHGIESAAVSFPGFTAVLAALGAGLEETA
jgi:3-phosphoshikimate 1-carboxyvinyltransferase